MLALKQSCILKSTNLNFPYKGKQLNHCMDFQTVSSLATIDSSLGKLSDPSQSEIIFTQSDDRNEANELFLTHYVPSFASKFYNTENYIFLNNLSASKKKSWKCSSKI